jgi:hypothetical protein
MQRKKSCGSSLYYLSELMLLRLFIVTYTTYPTYLDLFAYFAVCKSKKGAGDGNQWLYINSTALKWATS